MLLLFAHLGITLGAAVGINQLSRLGKSSKKEVEKSTPKGRMDLLDIIFCAVGSILPDILDKPVGHFLFSQTFGNNGRIFSHTLLFLLIVLGIGLYFYLVKKNTWCMFLAFGVLMHLILDFMWQTPQTLLWPLLGWKFPRSPDYNWLGSILNGLLHNPFDYITELIGLFILCLFVFVLIRNKYIVFPFRKKSRLNH